MSHIPLEQPSPSQIVLLREETFVRRWGTLKLPSGVRVSSRQLGETLIQVAFLACASQGILKLEIRPQKTLFGLRTVRVLFAEPQRTSVPWPESTLEARLTHLAVQLLPEERHRVQTMVYVLLDKNSPDPWRQIVDKVQGGLVELGILERMEERQSKIIRQYQAQVATSVADSVGRLPTSHVQKLLETCRLTSPRIWRLLCKEISRGISYRKFLGKGWETHYHELW